MLKTGLLIQNHDPRQTLERAIAQAVAIYYRKNNTMPEVCAINAGVKGAPSHVGAVRVVGMSTVLVGHYWVGMEENND